MKRALTILVFLLTTAAACGHNSGAATAVRSSVPAPVQRWEHQIDLLHDLIGGSPRERAAGDLVLFHRNEDPVASCMRAHGIDYRVPAWSDEWRLRDSRGLRTGSSLFLEPIDDPDYPVRVARAEALAQRGPGRAQRRAARCFRGGWRGCTTPWPPTRAAAGPPSWPAGARSARGSPPGSTRTPPRSRRSTAAGRRSFPGPSTSPAGTGPPCSPPCLTIA